MNRLVKIAAQSAHAVSANKARAGLTILGIVIGIAAVIALTGIGQGAANAITGRIASLGSTNLVVMPGGAAGQEVSNASSGQVQHESSGQGMFGAGASTLTQADLDALSGPGRDPAIKAAAGTVSASAIVTVNGQEEQIAISGVTSPYFSIYGLQAERGSLWGEGESGKQVVLGSEVAGELYGTQDPVGQSLEIQRQSFTITGVLAAGDESAFRNPNKQVYIPAQAAMDTFQISRYSTFTVQAVGESQVTAAKDGVEAALLGSHGVDNPKLADFSVLSPQDLLSVTNQVTGTLTALLAGIAAISLLVGGIGIMNIMLVSVAERTHEIGLRKAVGAKTYDILFQFLVEALILTLAGSALGVVAGFGIARMAGGVLGLQTAITGGVIVLAVGVAGAIGLVFGLYPAAKAARLNPIDALRYA